MIIHKTKLTSKILFIILFILAVLACFKSLTIWRSKDKEIMHNKDLSMEDSVLCDLDKNHNVWLMSYADGNEANFANQRALTLSSINYYRLQADSNL